MSSTVARAGSASASACISVWIGTWRAGSAWVVEPSQSGSATGWRTQTTWGTPAASSPSSSACIEKASRSPYAASNGVRRSVSDHRRSSTSHDVDMIIVTSGWNERATSGTLPPSQSSQSSLIAAHPSSVQTSPPAITPHPRCTESATVARSGCASAQACKPVPVASAVLSPTTRMRTGRVGTSEVVVVGAAVSVVAVDAGADASDGAGVADVVDGTVVASGTSGARVEPGATVSIGPDPAAK